MVKVDADEVLLELTNDFEIHEKLLQATEVFYRSRRGCESGSDQARKVYDALRKSVFDACRSLYPVWGRDDRVKTTALTEDIFCHYWESVSGTQFTQKVQENFRDNWSPAYCKNDFASIRNIELSKEMIRKPENTFDDDRDTTIQILKSRPKDDSSDVFQINRNFDEAKVTVTESFKILADQWPQPTKGIEMPQTIATKKLIDSRTYINGVESSQVTDEKIFSMISNYETEIESLKKIKNQPKALKAKVAFLQSQIDELVEFVDSRTGEVA